MLVLRRLVRHPTGRAAAIGLVLLGAVCALAPVLELVAGAGVNVEYAYGTAPDGGLVGSSIVIGVEDAVRAAAAAGV